MLWCLCSISDPNKQVRIMQRTFSDSTEALDIEFGNSDGSIKTFFWKCWSWWALHATYAHVFACGLCLESVPRGKNNSLSFELIDQFMWSFTCICAVAENCLDVSKLILMRVKAAARLGMIVSEMLRRLYNFMLKNFVRSSQNQTDVRKGTTSSSSTNFLWLRNK